MHSAPKQRDRNIRQGIKPAALARNLQHHGQSNRFRQNMAPSPPSIRPREQQSSPPSKYPQAYTWLHRHGGGAPARGSKHTFPKPLLNYTRITLVRQMGLLTKNFPKQIFVQYYTALTPNLLLVLISLRTRHYVTLTMNPLLILRITLTHAGPQDACPHNWKLQRWFLSPNRGSH